MIFAEKYLQHRYEVGLKEGFKEGSYAERKRWVAYAERMEKAEEAGEEFNEPPPPEIRRPKTMESIIRAAYREHFG